MHELICTKADMNRGLFHLDTFNFYSIYNQGQHNAPDMNFVMFCVTHIVIYF